MDVPSLLNNYFKLLTFVFLLNIALGGFSLMQGQMLSEAFWAGSPFMENAEVDFGLVSGYRLSSDLSFNEMLAWFV